MGWIWDNSGKLAELATVIAAIAIVVAIVAAWRHFTTQAALQRDAAAKDSFRDHLTTAIGYPMFAAPESSDIDYKQETFAGSKANYQGYVSFVSALLLAGDQILQNDPSHAWKLTIKAQLQHHWRYLLKDFETLRPEYSETLGALVDEVVRDSRFTRGKNPLSNLALSMAQRMLSR